MSVWSKSAQLEIVLNASQESYSTWDMSMKAWSHWELPRENIQRIQNWRRWRTEAQQVRQSGDTSIWISRTWRHPNFQCYYMIQKLLSVSLNSFLVVFLLPLPQRDLTNISSILSKEKLLSIWLRSLSFEKIVFSDSLFYTSSAQVPSSLPATL